jgi:hypothetical protein
MDRSNDDDSRPFELAAVSVLDDGTGFARLLLELICLAGNLVPVVHKRCFDSFAAVAEGNNTAAASVFEFPSFHTLDDEAGAATSPPPTLPLASFVFLSSSDIGDGTGGAGVVFHPAVLVVPAGASPTLLAPTKLLSEGVFNGRGPAAL